MIIDAAKFVFGKTRESAIIVKAGGARSHDLTRRWQDAAK